MDAYDVKSCNGLAKLHYRPIEAALRWCGLIAHEIEILKVTGEAQLPPLGEFPQWPCLRTNVERIVDAIETGEIPHGRDGKVVPLGDRVTISKRTIRHNDLKAWMVKNHPDQKPKFLFDEIERTTHAAINADSFRALQADRDALKARVEKAEEWARQMIAERKEMVAKCDSLAEKVDAMNTPNARATTTYLNIIGGMLGLMLCKTPAGKPQSIFQNQGAIIEALLAHYTGKPGISDTSLENKFAEANRSIKAT